MSACLPPELELMEKHEEILDRRAELLEQTESRRERLKIQMKKMVQESEAARQRNSALLQMRYWTSVEESVPAWESFLLSKGPHPTDGPEQQARRPKHKPSTAKDRGLPPRPQPRTAR
ncbi:uncharacterized protein C3orf14 homolog isoform X2 [Notolabrus celidotus]|uniref:uncharacterized protein C3orf14 homolog isoform X2 n=1 Tax=Notolabrus celidotus TaxID=1203425 RepID=UPI00148FC5DE|nr:uncharacterized protein C3orf14 homolog isoform X2 [Notolabrus celidotus]